MVPVGEKEKMNIEYQALHLRRSVACTSPFQFQNILGLSSPFLKDLHAKSIG